MRKRAYVPNTFIGGIAKLGGTGANAPILTAAELASRLGISVNIIKGFRVVGEDVECRIMQEYTAQGYAFGHQFPIDANQNITFFHDIENKCISGGLRIFGNCQNLTSVFLNGFINNGDSTNGGNFDNCIKLSHCEMDSLRFLRGYYFFRNTKISILNLNNLETITKNAGLTGNNFQNMTELTLLSAKKLKQIGDSPSVNYSNFSGIKLNATIEVHIDLATANNGDIDADLLSAYNSRNATINFYDDDGNFVETYNPSPDLYTQNDACSIGANETESIGVGWISEPNSLVTIENSTESNWCLKFITLDNSDTVSRLQISGLEIGETYEISLDGRAEDATGLSEGQGFIRTDVNNGWESLAYADIDSFNWQRKSFNAVATDTDAILEYYPAFTSSGIEIGWSGFLDNISIKKITNPEPEPEVFAFPTAYGAGAYTTGGRGGQVIHVTNLNNSGSGSLRAALLEEFPRIIVFDVSGTINLLSMIELEDKNSNFTVAGQSAPMGGITIAGAPIQLGGGYNKSNGPCNNVIIRYIRFRNGNYTGDADVYGHNGLISTGTEGLVLDHCSFSFCDDQAISLNAAYGDLKDISVQNCIFSENATQIIIGHNLSQLTDNISVIGNLFTDISHRTPNIGGLGSKLVDIINNVMVNYSDRLTNLNHTPDSRVNNIGNYYKRGSYSGSRHNVVQRYTGMMDTPLIYSAYNYDAVLYPTPVEGDNNLWTDFTNYGQALDPSFFTSTRFDLIGRDPVIKSAVQAFNDVQNNIGANKYLNADGTFGVYYDTYDETKLSNIGNDIYLDPYNKVWVQPVLPNNSRESNFYGTNQHIPSEFLANRGVGNTLTVHNDIAPSGYTWLEEYLNQVDQ